MLFSVGDCAGVLGCVPPFTDSAPDHAGGSCWGIVCGCGWVELFCCLVSNCFGPVWPVGLAHCWVLRRHLFVVGVFFRCHSWAGWPNARGCLCGGGVGGGVWLCVECCIVDASILLWSSV